jgi:two-component system sensor histidine kinase YesM
LSLRLTFRQRIYIFVSLTVAITIITTGWLIYRIAAKSANENAYILNQDKLNRASQALNEKLEKIKLTVYTLKVSTEYRRMFELDSIPGSGNHNTQMSALQATFIQMMTVEPWIDSILLSTPGGEYYLLPQQRNRAFPFLNSNLYNRFRQEGNHPREVWIEEHEDELFAGKHPVITYITEVTTNRGDSTTVVVNMRVGAFNQFLSENLGWDAGRFILASKDGKEVFMGENALNDGLLQSDSFYEALTEKVGTFNYGSGSSELFITHKRLDAVNDWTLFSLVPKSQLLKQTKDMRWTILWIVIGCVLVTFIFTQLIARLLLMPLKNLQSLMLKVENNDLSVRYELPYQDEIMSVGHRFNRMLGEIQRLLDRVKNAEEQKRKSEMKALQAQINPHFLYNTLNTIYWKSQMKQLEDVQEMVLSLSSLFQLGLNKGQEMTTLQNELVHAEQYLKIQQKCYEHLFEYSLDIDPHADWQQPIPKILLQPLVENAILHGFEDRNEGGYIHVEVRQTDSYLHLTVSDNGKGMPPSAPGNAKASLPPNGYALSNIVQRLELQYGDRAEIRVNNRSEDGTSITLILPVQSQYTPLS